MLGCITECGHGYCGKKLKLSNFNDCSQITRLTLDYSPRLDFLTAVTLLNRVFPFPKNVKLIRKCYKYV